jgi:17beta-estradiol 17-dehydrogenase / very-long-chain 3-oxoacyl-CoA reductase
MSFSFETPILCLGIVTATYLLFQIGQFAFVYLRPSSLPRYKHGEETWALITGASDGIGFGFAQELSRHNFNVILLGHKPAELENAKAILKLQSPQVRVRILVVDAISSSVSELKDALATLKELNITILINNVGGLPEMSESYFKTFDRYTAEEADGILNLNARFMAQITRLLLPDLSQNGPSLIMNIGSGAHLGVPYEVMYSGTKGFVASFSAALNTEAIAEGWPVDVMAIIPGNVRSGSNKVPLSWFIPSAAVFSRAALDRIGCGQPVVCGYWKHALQIIMLKSLPIWMQQQALIRQMRYTMATQVRDK